MEIKRKNLNNIDYLTEYTHNEFIRCWKIAKKYINFIDYWHYYFNYKNLIKVELNSLKNNQIAICSQFVGNKVYETVIIYNKDFWDIWSFEQKHDTIVHEITHAIITIAFPLYIQCEDDHGLTFQEFAKIFGCTAVHELDVSSEQNIIIETRKLCRVTNKILEYC